MPTQTPLEKAQAKLNMLNLQHAANEATFAAQSAALPISHAQRKELLEAQIAVAEADVEALQNG